MARFSKKSSLISLVLVAAVMLSLLAGCGSSDNAGAGSTPPKAEEQGGKSAENTPAQETKQYYFVFIPKVVHPWYEAVKTGATAAIEEYKKQGIEIKFEWDAPPTADVVVHTQKIESSVAKKPSVIAVSVLDEASDAPIIDQAVDAGAKVVTFDCDAPKSKRTMFVGHNKNEQDGAELADLLAKNIGEKGEVAILSGSLSAPNHKERVAGFKKAMEKYPEIKIVTEQADNDDLEKAIALTENILKANPNVKGIFGCNASNPIGAARAVKDAGKTGKVAIVGMDDMPETMQFIEEGVILGTKVQRVFDIGYNAIKYMVDIADGKSVPAEYQTGSYIVTKDNMDEYKKNTAK